MAFWGAATATFLAAVVVMVVLPTRPGVDPTRTPDKPARFESGSPVETATLIRRPSTAAPVVATTPDPSTGRESLSCADLWIEIRSSLVASGVGDGDARRAADEARAACEEEEMAHRPPVTEPPLACVSDTDRRIASFIEIQPSDAPLGVYYVCAGDAVPSPSGRIPMYRFDKAIEPGEGRAEILTSVLRAYFEGAGEAEALRGYGSLPPDLGAGTLLNAQVAGSRAVVNLAPSIEQQVNLSTTAAYFRFLEELSANVFQLKGISSLELRIDGDCRRFWAGTPAGPVCLILASDGSVIEE